MSAIIEKEIHYTICNTYSTLNTLDEKTTHQWFVIHGLGFLSRYFIKYFEGLPDTHYVIAPQAQSKHYLNNKYKHVGATWLTKDNTQDDIPNVLEYLNSIHSSEFNPNTTQVMFGFSQGVSIITRWIGRHQIPCDILILYAGKIPREFKPEDFEHVKQVKLIVGDADEYVTSEVLKAELDYATSLFGNRLTMQLFNGKHEVKSEIINRFG